MHNSFCFQNVCIDGADDDEDDDGDDDDGDDDGDDNDDDDDEDDSYDDGDDDDDDGDDNVADTCSLGLLQGGLEAKRSSQIKRNACHFYKTQHLHFTI